MDTSSRATPGGTGHDASREQLERRAVAAAIALPAMLVQQKGHGHGGTPMALAPLAHTLYSRVMRHNPANPLWPGRDRFVLSAGHAGLLQYVQLYLTGYGLTLDDLRAARSLDSLTPGHPEHGHTEGIEASTGPLGQGVAMGVGMALAARREAAEFGADTGLFDTTVWVVAGDGCLQEGVSAEASSLAGTLGLDNLVMVWDDNRVTIDALTEEAFTEDVRARYRAYGWHVIDVEDHRDVDALQAALETAREHRGSPVFIALRTVIGDPSPAYSGRPEAHYGGFGEEEVQEVLELLGFARDAELEDLVPDEVLAFTREAIARGAEAEAQWQRRFDEWRQSDPEEAGRWQRLRDGEVDLAPLDDIALPGVGEPQATRKASGAVIKAMQSSGTLWGGSADLASSTNVAVPGQAVSADRPAGEFIRFGIREHAMAGVLNGIALHGCWRPFGSTYLVFSDYMRPAVRLAALMELPVVFVYTHDSLAVGEDGPTHQPVEQVPSLRSMPGLAVVRPADGPETVAAWRRILTDRRMPAALVLSRQDVPVLPERQGLDAGVKQGGYVAWQHGDGDAVALIATGSEVSLAVDAARTLADRGIAVRVVSMPCVEWFEQASPEWRERVLPDALRARVTIEASSPEGWYRFAGLDGEVLGVDRFGESGSGAELMRRRGFTAEAIIAAAERVLARHGTID
ncbi:transketolase [Ruicaihuangia caeni]|uniref:Transketolase n=1 Tax=Ruicaihuangia caeni TaxID=3042517 RepID=A0AAW6T294_9MICO|nr:transketolase [Klugiella sp. YN-L-19]MDI2097926.1 transketolase [Klugiella sp. YN-L-19]